MSGITDVNRLIRNVNNGWMSVKHAPGADVLYVDEKLLLLSQVREINSKETRSDLLEWFKGYCLIEEILPREHGKYNTHRG